MEESKELIEENKDKDKVTKRNLASGETTSIQNNSDTNKPKDPEVDTDEGDLVNDEFAVSLGYYKGDFEKAKEFREDTLVRDVNNKKFMVCKVSNYKFGEYGAGVYLYFEYLKFLSIGFGVMSIIMIPSLLSNILGDYYGSGTESYFDYTTLGNQEGYPDGTTNAKALTIDDDNEAWRAISITCDVLNTLALYIYLLIFNIVSRNKIRDLNRRKQTPSDYSIYVSGFDFDTTGEDEVRKYFEKYGEIIEIVFAHKFGKMMKDYISQDKLNKSIKKREISVKVKAEEEQIGIKEAIKNDDKLMKLVKKDNEMEEKIRNKYPDIKSIEDVSKIGAFVVFNEASSVVKCVEEHGLFKSIKEVNFKTKIKQADEPNNILWENLEVSYTESFLRSAVVIFLVVILLIGALFAVYGMRTYQNKLPETDDCEQYADLTLDTVDKTNEDALD